MNVLIIGFVLLSELSMGQYSFLYITMTLVIVAKELAGECKFHFLDLCR